MVYLQVGNPQKQTGENETNKAGVTEAKWCSQADPSGKRQGETGVTKRIAAGKKRSGSGDRGEPEKARKSRSRSYLKEGVKKGGREAIRTAKGLLRKAMIRVKEKSNPPRQSMTNVLQRQEQRPWGEREGGESPNGTTTTSGLWRSEKEELTALKRPAGGRHRRAGTMRDSKKE